MAASARRASWTWTAAAALILVVGLVLRLVLGGGGVGDRSAIVMTVLLAASAWLAVQLLAGPRVALFVTLALVVILDLAALPARRSVEYDDLQAFYSTDQTFAAQLAVPPGSAGQDLAISLLAQPVFNGAQAQFGLAGDVDGTAMQWTCQFQHGVQRIALPLSTIALNGTADVRLHLSGAPNRESEYLVVYASSRLGGFMVSLQRQAMLDSGVTRCSTG